MFNAILEAQLVRKLAVTVLQTGSELFFKIFRVDTIDAVFLAASAMTLEALPTNGDRD
jgi:hypothetical protein